MTESLENRSRSNLRGKLDFAHGGTMISSQASSRQARSKRISLIIELRIALAIFSFALVTSSCAAAERTASSSTCGCSLTSVLDLSYSESGKIESSNFSQVIHGSQPSDGTHCVEPSFSSSIATCIGLRSTITIWLQQCWTNSSLWVIAFLGGIAANAMIIVAQIVVILIGFFIMTPRKNRPKR